MTRRRSRGEMEIEARLQNLDPGTPRHRVLLAARDFRASWVELGERLTEVREGNLYEQWGYTNFESYCRRELRLRGDTVNKLTRSFSFLRDHEPRALEEQESREVPALDVVDLLSRARERTKVSEADLQNIQQECFSPEGPATRSQVVRRFREVDPDAFRSAPRQSSPATEAGEQDLRKALLLAERLQALLNADAACSEPSQRAIASVVDELRGRFELSQRKSA